MFASRSTSRMQYPTSNASQLVACGIVMLGVSCFGTWSRLARLAMSICFSGFSQDISSGLSVCTFPPRARLRRWISMA